MKLRYAPFFALLLTVLTACATLNVPAPTTWNQRVLAAYNLEDGVVQSVQTLTVAGKVSKADAQKFHDNAVELKNDIDLADQLHGNNPAEGEQALTTAIGALQALQIELQKRQKP
jgi:hypothetical protein